MRGTGTGARLSPATPVVPSRVQSLLWRSPRGSLRMDGPPRRENAGDVTSTITVRLMTGKTVQVAGQASDTVTHIKAKIHAQEGIQPDCQRLILDGKEPAAPPTHMPRPSYTCGGQIR